jgi:hypothetical protein
MDRRTVRPSTRDATAASLERERQRLAELQLKKQQQQITQNETDELAYLIGKMNINRGGKRSKRRRTNKRRRTFRKKRSTKRRRR